MRPRTFGRRGRRALAQDDCEAMTSGGSVERMQARIEEHAPGFGEHVIARHVQGPDDIQATDGSLVGGDISGGTSQLHQQLVFRPVPGLGRAETPIAGSSSPRPRPTPEAPCTARVARTRLAPGMG